MDLEPGSGAFLILDPGSSTSKHAQELSDNYLGFKMLKFFVAIPRSDAFLSLDLGYGMEKFGSGINIPVPQH